MKKNTIENSAFAPSSSMAEVKMSAEKLATLQPLTKNWDHSWVRQLSPESNPPKGDNRRSRPVRDGHYVEVEPSPLKNPRLVAHSPEMARSLGLDETVVQSEDFARFFSGDMAVAGDAAPKTWATPYALAIMGNRMTSNCPFGTGDGYGDGRAISVGEVLVPAEAAGGAAGAAPQRWELQLKGGGRTPFCRGADGRAVLRSSIREFLASEAMHHLGVETTRALSLVVSEGGDVSRRPWYAEALGGPSRALPDMDDPRLAGYSLEQRRQILDQLRNSKRDPDVMVEEPNAITCRVAPSFLRVGHLDLHARRAARAAGGTANAYARGTAEFAALEQLVWHAGFREFPAAAAPLLEAGDLPGAVRAVLRGSAEGIAAMVAGWLRVGFAQGNFNCDNCLVAGRTMDYGPFGWMDRYEPLFAKWTGSGEHFGFLNQPTAGLANFITLLQSLGPMLDDYQQEFDELAEHAKGLFEQKVDEVWRAKLGFAPGEEARAAALWEQLEPLLRSERADWTLFWRQLTAVAAAFPDPACADYADMTKVLLNEAEVAAGRPGASPFYKPAGEVDAGAWHRWLQAWREAHAEAAAARGGGGSSDGEEGFAVAEVMRRANPKYVLREWMLVECYTRAAAGDEGMVHELLGLVRSPYEEGTAEQHARYYRRAPEEALTAGGTAFMS
uniref:Selenoprotein O n=1 Tax=Heterosigma akashiwo TaxID=2829 RepID=A0A7S3URY2_HETAK